MFERLPHELLKFIISEISIQDVKNLSQTSKHFHSSTLPTLWTSVVIPAWSTKDTYGIRIDGFPLDRLVFMKSISLRFVTENNARACPHDRRLQTCQEANDEEIVDKLSSFEKLTEVILALLEKFEKEQLTSFRLHLETLELDLVNWPHLRKALGYRNDNERVRRMRARDYMHKSILGLDIHSPHITFPNLHTLVLSHVPLTATLVQSINFEVLRSLTIRSCPQWYDFVLAIARRRIPVRLKELELQESWPKNDAATDETEDGDPTEVLLEYFQGLEKFYLDQTGDMLSKDTWENVCHHSSTLKRFVNHSNFYNEELEVWTDLPDMMINERDKERWWDDPTSSPLYNLDLDFIGLSCEPIHLLDVLNPFSKKDCLKVVHVRQSRKNLEYTWSWGIMVITDDEPVDDTPAVDEGENPSSEYLEPMFWAFVEWAFSYKGIKSLEYIVFGDFGRPERTSRGNLLICREGYGSEDFHIIRESCPSPEWDYVKKEYGDALRSCPSLRSIV
ncbi:AAA family ATPase [Fusarium phyllophilum]|uniref:AAA family ATPase n=1 Tax=Fusarium phyllophilum TaxID=47803 RepID=A0A8H5JWH9_9HYPO|nr:AAA family ATPase [Fusarium phyllophilum]